MRIDLITPDGRYDKAAILRDAHCHQYGAMRRHGWSWSRCLSFSWARARAMQESAQLAASGEEEGAAFAGGSQRVYGALARDRGSARPSARLRAPIEWPAA
jgi:hypothetical protein